MSDSARRRQPHPRQRELRAGAAPFSNQDIDIATGSTAITGWTVTGNGIDLLGAPWDVSDGVRAIDLDGRAPGGIAQTFATAIGRAYVVSFDLSGNPGNGPGTGLPRIKQVRVAVGGVTQDYTFDSSGLHINALDWLPISFGFIASDLTETLSFTSLSPAGNAYGALIDNVGVSATAIPELPTMLLVGAGLVAVGAVRRARRQGHGVRPALELSRAGGRRGGREARRARNQRVGTQWCSAIQSGGP